MSATPASKPVEPGDVVETSGRHVGDPGRRGAIVSILGADNRPHFLVRWEDGRESILYPGEGTTIRPGDREVGWAD